jgi:hypothetical protein
MRGTDIQRRLTCTILLPAFISTDRRTAGIGRAQPTIAARRTLPKKVRVRGRFPAIVRFLLYSPGARLPFNNHSTVLRRLWVGKFILYPPTLKTTKRKKPLARLDLLGAAFKLGSRGPVAPVPEILPSVAVEVPSVQRIGGRAAVRERNVRGRRRRDPAR